MWGTIVPAATTTLRRTVLTFIRFDMRAPASGPASAAELHTATLDMAEWADRLGFDSLVVSEHHGAEDGFLPSPIVAAAAIAGRTKRAGISISALLAPLHDPIRIAEDLAVLDLLSEGRVTTILGLGYRPEEYEMFDAPWATRGAYFDEWVQALLDAWKGEPFLYQGRKIPAVTHKDGSARVQTVRRDQQAEFYDLIAEFDRRTNCPVIINTSFNVRGEPIVCTPEDAYLCFMRTNMDLLVLGNFLLEKKDQPELKEDFDWREKYALD